MKRFLTTTLPPITVLVVLAMAEVRQLILKPGYIIYRDLFPGQMYYPTLWQSAGSFLAIENYKFVTFTGWWLFLRPFGLDVYEKAVYLSGFAVAFLALYAAVYQLIGWIEGDSCNLLVRTLASLLAALVYVASPSAANIFFDFSLWVGYAFAPLSLILYMKALAGRQRSLLAVFLIGGIWWLSAIKAHWIVFGMILLIPPLLTWVRKTWQAKEFVRALAITSGVTFVYLLLSAYWLLPFLQASEGRFVGSYAPMTLEAVDLLSNTPLDQVVRMLGTFQAWPYVVYDSPSSQMNFLWQLTSWIIPLIVLAGLIIYRHHWQAQSAGLLAALGILLAKGVAAPFGEIYHFLVFGFLTPGAFRWLFRVASKWNVFVNLGYCILLGLGLYVLLIRAPHWLKSARLKAKPVYFAGATLFTLAFIFFAWPSFSGDFRGALDPVALPADLQNANQWLAQTGGNSKVHWMPVTNGRELSWNRKPSGDFYAGISPIPSIATNWNRHPVLYYSYAYEALVNQRLNSFGKLMSILNIRYLAYHNDVISTHVHEDVEPVSVLIEPGEEKIPLRLREQGDIQVIQQQEGVELFQTREDTPTIYIPRQQFLTTSGLPILTSLSAISGFQPAQNAILFDGSRNSGTFSQPVDGLLLDRGGLDQLQFAFLPAEKFIPAGASLLHGVPTEDWAKLDIFQFDWQSLLHTYAINDWDFDYGAGIAVYTDEMKTSGKAVKNQPVLNIPVKVEQSGDFQLWIRSLRLPRAALLRIEVDGLEQASLNNRSEQTGLFWANCGSLHLGKGMHTISIQSSNGLGAINVLSLLTAEEQAQMQKQAIDLANRVVNLYPLELENDFWPIPAQDQLTDAAYSAGRAVALHPNTSLRTNLNLITASAYQLSLRVTANTPPAAIQLKVNNQEIKFHLDAHEEQFDWLISEPTDLKAGLISIELNSYVKVVADALVVSRGLGIAGSGASSVGLPAFFSQGADQSNEVSFEKIDPTRYRVRVKADHPYILALAETYDPLWVAEGVDFQVKSQPLYGVINGFPISKTGTYELTIEYLPQQGARLGQIISFGIFILWGVLFLVSSRMQNGLHLYFGRLRVISRLRRMPERPPETPGNGT